ASLISLGLFGLLGFTNTAISSALGTTPWISLICWVTKPSDMLTTPVILPSGCFRAVISPNWIGSALDEKIIGIVVVALLAANAAGPPPAIIAATLWFTNVAANHGSKS